MAINDQEKGADLFDSPPKSSPYADFDAMTTNEVLINDAVHGQIRLPPVCIAVIDTLEFQRLRALKQCGICNLVYPTANHSRFEHSLGVCHLAREFMQHCGADITKEKKLCVMLAGLCHDLGHGPFSHLWERFLTRSNKKWKHEENSVKMFRALVKNNNLQPIFRENGLKEEHEEFICNLILGRPPQDETELFLYEIIANERNGIDVDKFEYIMRDSQQFGVKMNLEVPRIINHIGVVEKEGKKYIGFRDKISDCLFEIFETRAKLHKNCYQHRTCKAVEMMLLDALCAADKHFRISWIEPVVGDPHGEIRSCKMSECHQNTNAFLKADDTIFCALLNSTSPELLKARRILESMLKRDIYALVFDLELETDANDDDLRRRLEDALTVYYGEKHGCEFHSCFKSLSIEIKGGEKPDVLFFEKNKPNEPFKKRMSSFMGESGRHRELLIFCTLGKKSLGLETLNNMREFAKYIYKNI
ncbi:SAM domain and HD [Nesidiocoris tenuis]|uniref:SAM domain and HD n=1 Tax=Nesidiocoris tenuis TaxID=355587 RepID=A0ABN7AX46_9HEMI|nr:SAM domain and HD [Nesidiocoris tenuis]